MLKNERGPQFYGTVQISLYSKMSTATRAYFKNYESAQALAKIGEGPSAPQIYGAASPGSHRPGKGIVKRSPPWAAFNIFVNGVAVTFAQN